MYKFFMHKISCTHRVIKFLKTEGLDYVTRKKEEERNNFGIDWIDFYNLANTYNSIYFIKSLYFTKYNKLEYQTPSLIHFLISLLNFCLSCIILGRIIFTSFTVLFFLFLFLVLAYKGMNMYCSYYYYYYYGYFTKYPRQIAKFTIYPQCFNNSPYTPNFSCTKYPFF